MTLGCGWRSSEGRHSALDSLNRQTARSFSPSSHHAHRQPHHVSAFLYPIRAASVRLSDRSPGHDRHRPRNRRGLRVEVRKRLQSIRPQPSFLVHLSPVFHQPRTRAGCSPSSPRLRFSSPSFRSSSFIPSLPPLSSCTLGSSSPT